MKHVIGVHLDCLQGEDSLFFLSSHSSYCRVAHIPIKGWAFSYALQAFEKSSKRESVIARYLEDGGKEQVRSVGLQLAVRYH